jgi:hypothetical protein
VTYSTAKVPCLNGEPHKWRKADEWGDYKSRSCRSCQKRQTVKVGEEFS